MGETPPNPPPPPLAVSISLFFLNPNNKHTQPQETTTPPRDPKMASEGGRGQPGLAGRESGRGGGGKSSPLQSLCFSFQQALGRGPPCQGGHGVGSGRGSRGGSRNGVQNRGSHHAVSTVGTKRGRGWTPHPPALGTGGNGAHLGWGGGRAATPGTWGEEPPGRKRVDWCPVDALSSAPSTQPDLIGLFVIY